MHASAICLESCIAIHSFPIFIQAAYNFTAPEQLAQAQFSKTVANQLGRPLFSTLATAPDRKTLCGIKHCPETYRGNCPAFILNNYHSIVLLAADGHPYWTCC